ncbi:hypothetical protein YIM_21715 [Amycolatopsis sp. YIM 10]|nr:hypothetical protein YIM_21715 [Amycolatopsis sp. YIM 10]
MPAPGSIVVVIRDVEWLVRLSRRRASGPSAMLFATSALRSTLSDDVVRWKPTSAQETADDGLRYCSSRLWPESTICKVPMSLNKRSLAVAVRRVLLPVGPLHPRRQLALDRGKRAARRTRSRHVDELRVCAAHTRGYRDGKVARRGELPGQEWRSLEKNVDAGSCRSLEPSFSSADCPVQAVTTSTGPSALSQFRVRTACPITRCPGRSRSGGLVGTPRTSVLACDSGAGRSVAARPFAAVLWSRPLPSGIRRPCRR